MTFLSNTLSKLTSGAARTYRGITAGYDITNISNVLIESAQLTSGATTTITWLGSGTRGVTVVP